MKRSQAFPSTYMGKEDCPAPFSAVVRDVRMETLKTDHGEEEKPVLYFADLQLKPMILNNTNWLVLETAYGEDSISWTGKLAEIYVDPGVMFGSKRVGGLRLRIPKGPLPATSNHDVLLAELRSAAEIGTEELRVAWQRIGNAARITLKDELAGLKEIAARPKDQGFDDDPIPF